MLVGSCFASLYFRRVSGGLNRKEGTHYKTSTDLWLFKGMASTDNASLSHVAFLMRHTAANRGTLARSRASRHPVARPSSMRKADSSAARVSRGLQENGCRTFPPPAGGRHAGSRPGSRAAFLHVSASCERETTTSIHSFLCFTNLPSLGYVCPGCDSRHSHRAAYLFSLLLRTGQPVVDDPRC